MKKAHQPTSEDIVALEKELQETEDLLALDPEPDFRKELEQTARNLREVLRSKDPQLPVLHLSSQPTPVRSEQAEPSVPKLPPLKALGEDPLPLVDGQRLQGEIDAQIRLYTDIRQGTFLNFPHAWELLEDIIRWQRSMLHAEEPDEKINLTAERWMSRLHPIVELSHHTSQREEFGAYLLVYNAINFILHSTEATDIEGSYGSRQKLSNFDHIILRTINGNAARGTWIHGSDAPFAAPPTQV